MFVSKLFQTNINIEHIRLLKLSRLEYAEIVIFLLVSTHVGSKDLYIFIYITVYYLFGRIRFKFKTDFHNIYLVCQIKLNFKTTFLPWGATFTRSIGGDFHTRWQEIKSHRLEYSRPMERIFDRMTELVTELVQS